MKKMIMLFAVITIALMACDGEKNNSQDNTGLPSGDAQTDSSAAGTNDTSSVMLQGDTGRQPQQRDTMR